MRLEGFSVEDYRSITGARKIPLSGYSVLVGPNNEGKSNILHALSIGMEALSQWHREVRRTRDGRLLRPPLHQARSRAEAYYNWDRDYPISKQRKLDGKTYITLDFSLTELEVAEFYAEIGSKLNGILPIVVTFGRDSYDLSVQKPGKGSVSLNKKSVRIAEFVSRKIRFEYIPTIRTSSAAIRAISSLVNTELQKLNELDEYREALEAIKTIQQPILDKISKSLRETVSNFLPSVKSINIALRSDVRNIYTDRNIDIIVDDGQRTSLSRKGDGVQSLVALALMKDSYKISNTQETSIIAIEEPESHLHPKAIHELKSVIEELSLNSQIILTSHSPFFVRPRQLTNTVIVENSKARCAEHISEVRDVLGVRFSDNLQNARLVLLLEGYDDVRSLSSIISSRSETIRSALSSGEIAFDHLSGASALSYKATSYKSSACEIQCFLDNDIAGKNAVEKAISSKSVSISEVNLCIIQGLDESELEDLYDLNIYHNEFKNKFGVDLKIKHNSVRKKKWSDRVAKIFNLSGKPWDDSIKAATKSWLADYAIENPENILNESRIHPLISFIQLSERKLHL